MDERRNRATGQKFYGCSAYPECKMTLTAADYNRLNGLPAESLEEEQQRLKLGDGENRDDGLKPDFWGQDDDFAGVTGVEPGDEDIPEEM